MPTAGRIRPGRPCPARPRPRPGARGSPPRGPRPALPTRGSPCRIRSPPQDRRSFDDAGQPAAGTPRGRRPRSRGRARPPAAAIARSSADVALGCRKYIRTIDPQVRVGGHDAREHADNRERPVPRLDRRAEHGQLRDEPDGRRDPGERQQEHGQQRGEPGAPRGEAVVVVVGRGLGGLASRRASSRRTRRASSPSTRSGRTSPPGSRSCSPTSGRPG